MIQFTTIIKKFIDKGEKTGWSYIEIPALIAQKLKPDTKKSFRVKGKLDDLSFNQTALLPMGEGNFIMALKADIRKKIKKIKGASVAVKIEVDKAKIKLNAELMECLADDPQAKSFFYTLSPGHRKYFSNFIESAKTDGTRTRRIAQALNALSNHQGYGEMIRATKKDKDLFIS